MTYLVLGIIYAALFSWFKEKRDWRDFIALLFAIVLWPLMLIGDVLECGSK